MAKIEERLRSHPNVLGVHVDAPHEVAHVQVHEGSVSAAQLAELIFECCGGRCPVPLPDAAVSSHDHGHIADRSSGADAPEARAMAHAEQAGMAHAGHDMSDPGMAAAMEADMRRRFWISLALAVPVLAYSPLATSVLRLRRNRGSWRLPLHHAH